MSGGFVLEQKAACMVGWADGFVCVCARVSVCVRFFSGKSIIVIASCHGMVRNSKTDYRSLFLSLSHLGVAQTAGE